MKRPPREIAPRDFFEEWLPLTFLEEFTGRRAERVSGVHVRVILDGPQGGAWDLRIEGGRLHPQPPTMGEAPITVSQTVQDFRAVMFGEEGAFDLAPPLASPLDLLFVDPQIRHLISTMRGALRFEVVGYHGRTWALTAKFGDQPPGPPDATLSVDAEVYEEMRAKRLAPAEAYIGGKIRIAGNAALAMQLAMAILPRFTG